MYFVFRTSKIVWLWPNMTNWTSFDFSMIFIHLNLLLTWFLEKTEIIKIWFKNYGQVKSSPGSQILSQAEDLAGSKQKIYTRNAKITHFSKTSTQIARVLLPRSTIIFCYQHPQTGHFGARFSVRQGLQWVPLNGNHMFAIQKAAAANVISCPQECDWNKNNP